MECVEFDGDLILNLLPSKLVVHIASIKHSEHIKLFLDCMRRLVTALDAIGVYTFVGVFLGMRAVSVNRKLCLTLQKYIG